MASDFSNILHIHCSKKVGPPSHILYAASGGSFDWVKATAGVKYAYALELRPDKVRQ